MSLIEAIILGLIQGLTEFLPVSSSGHIELGKALFGLRMEEGLLFTIILHFATAISTVVVFYKEIVGLFKGLFQFRWNAETQYALLILISMIPAGIVGLMMKDFIDNFFDSNVFFVSMMLLVTGVILYISDRSRDRDKPVTKGKAAILGVVQAIAILPGISRSGSTIASAVLLGIDREKAARFSFLMVLPLIFGAMAAELKDYFELSQLEKMQMELSVLPTLAGFIAALISGYFACKWMIQLVKRAKLKYFSLYCWIVAVAGLVWSYFI